MVQYETVASGLFSLAGVRAGVRPQRHYYILCSIILLYCYYYCYYYYYYIYRLDEFIIIIIIIFILLYEVILALLFIVLTLIGSLNAPADVISLNWLLTLDVITPFNV